MAQLIGIINEISGVFYAKGSDGETRVLKSGDQLFVGETIIGDSANGAQSFITFALAEGGKEYTVNGNEQLLLDSSILPSQLASDNVVQPEDLEEALMLDTTYDDASGAQADAAGEEIANAEDIENLEETAAAGTTEVDALAGRFEDRTGDEIDITTDLRDATFPAGTDTVIDEGEDLVAENLPPDITVDPGNPTGADDVVYESGMAVGSDSSSNTEFAYGTFTVSDPDGLADVQSVSINGITIPIAELGNNNVIQSLYGLGTLTVTSYDSTTGVAEYQYELTSATTDVEGVAETDTFVLTAYDGNVDSAEADITINIVDDVPSVDVGLLYGGDFQLPVLTTFDENTIGDNSDSGSGAIPFGGLFTLTQNMGADQGGTPASLNYELSFSNSSTGLTSNGEDITLVNNNGVIEGRTSLSEPIFTISVDGSGNVTLIQNIKIDHVGEELDGSSTNNDVNTAGLLAGNVILTATASITDADGDTATDSETIDISSAVNFIDDVPSMSVSGAATVAEDATSAVSGSWDNANAGADEAASTVVVIGSNEYALGSDINLTEGTLNVATDGTWTFDPNTGLDQDSPQSVTFSVKVTDNDGDVASDNHTITITDGTGPSDADAITLTTDEADMSADDTGTLNFTFGSDAFESMAFSTDLTGLIEDTNATESGNDVVWTRTSATEITGTIDGQLAITLTLTPNLINGTASVKADIADNFDSIFANNGTNTLTLGSVDVIATDIDGDTAEGTVNVEVVDDVPSMSVSGAATVAEDATSAVSGSWDNANAGADEAASTVVVIGSNEYALGSDINLTEGTLNVATDGTWTFDPNTGLDQDSPQSVTFSVKVTDNDGDVASDNHTITITDGTGPSDADAITLTTDEADMSADDTGTLNFTFGSDAFESMAFSTDLTGLIEDTNATESGNDVVWTRTSATEITGTIDGQLAITLTLTPNLINGTASVKADIADNFDSIFANNGTNTLTLGSVDVIATDIDGDTAEGTVNVEVVDDVPSMSVSGAATVAEDATSAVSGSWDNANAGADEAASTVVVIGSNEYALGSDINLTEGTLNVATDGTWTFDPNTGLDQDSPQSVTFSVKVTDNDGDVASDNHTITITDGTGPSDADAITLTTDEADMSADDTGTLNFTFGSDAFESMAFSTDLTGLIEDTNATESGNDVVWTRTSATEITGTIDGQLAITLTLTPNLINGTASVKADIADNFDSIFANNGTNTLTLGSVDVIATDIDGDTAEGTVNVEVVDDVPSMSVSGAATVAEDATSAVSGSWDNANAGADEAASTVVVIGSNEYALGSDINLTEGTLNVATDGTWTFDPNTGLDQDSPQSVTFSVKVTDNDGDVASDNHTITITDGTGPSDADAITLTTDEADMSADDTGTLNFTFGSDAFESMAFSTDLTGLIEDTNATESGNDVVWTRTSATEITGTIDGQLAITLTLTPNLINGTASVKADIADNFDSIFANNGTNTLTLGSVDVIATDIDGDTAEGTVNVEVVDDVPSMSVSGAATVAEDATSAVSGSWDNANAGADEAASTVVVIGSNEYALGSDINLTEGTLNVATDGTWTFDPNTGLDQDSPQSVTFSVKVTDNDGDVASDNHTITITDGTGPSDADAITLTTDEADMSADDTGTLNFTFGSDAFESMAFSTDLTGLIEDTNATESGNDVVWTRTSATEITGTIDGQLAITLTLTPNLINGTASVKADIADNFDSIFANNGTNTLTLGSVDVIATDIDGDTAEGTVNVEVVDDVPSMSVSGAATVAEDATSAVSGSWDNANAGADEAASTVVVIGSNEYALGSDINLTEGTLNVATDGTWTFDPNTGLDQDSPQSVTFSVKVTDNDGDVASDNHTITITDGTGPSDADAITLTTDEADMSADDTGTLNFTFGSDAFESMAFSTDLTGLIEDTNATESGNDVVWTRTSATEITGTIDGQLAITLTLTPNLINGTASVKADIADNFDSIFANNGTNTLTLGSVDVIATDIDGDTAEGTVNVEVVDDVPSMSVSGAATVAEDATSAVSGSWDNANAGADEAASTVVVIGSNEYALGSDINLTEGTLNVATDGTWTFDPNTGLDQDSPQSVTFSVKVTDNDGDVASDNHTITITDGTGPSDADAITLTTDEADMSADDTGTLNFTFGSDAFESMAFSTDLTGLIEDTNATESGNDVVWTRTSATEITGTIDGQLAITLTLTPNLINGTASVKADIADNFDSIFANNGTNTLTLGSVDVIATDIDGDTAEGTVNVEVVDDVPSMSVSGAATVAEDATSAVSGSWDNANAGADEAASTVVVIGSNEYALGSDINLTEGTLNVATDGTWTFDPNTGLDQDSPQSVTFSVKVTDNDGDVASDNHTITITDGTGPSDADAITLTTDEADMSADDTGTLNFTFGSDAFESMAFSTDLTGLIEDTNATESGNDVVWTRTSATEITGTIDGQLAITLTLTPNLINGTASVKADIADNFDSIFANNGTNTLTLGSVDVIATDIDGDTAEGTVNVEVVDDVPSMSVSGAATVAEDATSAVSGSWDNANAGADEAASTVVVIGSNEYALGSDINLTEGTLNVATDGTWTFDPNTGLDQDSPQSVTFSVKVTDNDGDVASDNHTITITDGTGPSDADAITLTTDEADMSADDTGTLNFTFGSDAFESMAFSTDLTGLIEDTNATESGNDVVWTRTSATEITGTIDGQLAITLTLTPNLINGTASVKADIADNFDSIFANNGTNTLTLGSVDVIATDIDGDTAEGTVNVEVVDDVPSMSVSGAATVAEDATSAVSGSWDNANAGADEAASTVVVIGSNEYALGSDINLTEGTLNVATDGTWTFDPNTGLDQDSPQSVTFSVKVTDNDGDVASDNHTITITDGTGPSDADAITLTTDEADMSADDTGTLNFTFGSDAFESMAFSTDLTGLIEDTNATESGNDVVWTRTSATEITGTIDGQLAITLTLTPNLINGTASVKADIADNFDSIFANNGTNTLTLGSVDVIATDIDGDTAEGTVNVEVVDDVPTITSVESAVLDNDASGYVDGDSVLSMGADQPGSADLTGNISGWDGTAVTFAASTLTSGGETVYYFVDPLNTGVLYGYTDSAVTAGEYDSSSTTQSLIFTLSYNTNGDYVIDMNGKLDSSTQTFGSTFNETIGGNQDYLLITDAGEIYKPGETVPATENVIMSVDSAGGEVNSSVQGLASDSQWVVGTDEIYFTFTNPVVSASFSIGIQSNAASNEVHWTAYGTDGDGNLVQESGDTVFLNGVLQEIPTTLTSIVSVHLSDNDGGNGFRVSGSEIVASVVEDPLNTSFEVAITDEDGDTASSTLDVQFNPVVEGRFIVGSSEDDVSGSTDLHTVPQASVGVLEGGAGDDVVSGDPGGTTLVPGSTANIIFVLDISGSMTTNISFGSGWTSRIEALKSSVIDSLGDLAASGAQAIRVHLVSFDESASSLGTYDISTTAGYNAAVAAINGLSTGGGTNYEAGLVEANNWINSTGTDAPLADADVNKLVFVSDGEPNYALNNDGDPVSTSSWGSDGSTVAMEHVLGTYDPYGTHNDDNESEITAIEEVQGSEQAFTIEAIGINVSSDNLVLLSQLEGAGGDATNVTSAEELTSVIGELSGASSIQDAVGNDYIEGGEGNDLIFGDVFNTDQLAIDEGLSTPEGSGWLVFQQLENGNGTTTGWDRTNTLQYILDNQQTVATESGREGGNDEIYGGAGDDVIFGQEGNDTIDGGEGVDTIYGGSGDDTIVFDPADTIDGGAGNDTLFISNSMNLDFSNVDSINSSRIDNIETIDLSGGGSNVVTNLTVDDVFDMTATDNNINTLKIIGDGASDSVKVDTTTEWTDTNTTTNIDGINYNVYDNSGSVVGDPTVTLLVQQDIVEEI